MTQMPQVERHLREHVCGTGSNFGINLSKDGGGMRTVKFWSWNQGSVFASGTGQKVTIFYPVIRGRYTDIKEVGGKRVNGSPGSFIGTQYHISRGSRQKGHD